MVRLAVESISSAEPLEGKTAAASGDGLQSLWDMHKS
jgi:hypothetical protein